MFPAICTSIGLKATVKTNKRAAVANVQTHKRAKEQVVAIRRGERVLVNKDHFIASSDDE